MAKNPAGSAASSAQEKKAAKQAAKAAKKDRRGQLWQAFQMQRKQDKRLLPYMIGVFLLAVAVSVGVGLLVGGPWWMLASIIVTGAMLGVLIALIIFSRRVQSSVYKQAEGTPGAAAWSLQNNLRGKWRVTPAVAGTAQLDAIHRVVGRPGIVLVGEGAPQRVKPLLAQEKKRIARVVGETPIYDVIIGNEDGQVPLRKLNQYMMKLPRNIAASSVGDLDNRLAALAQRNTQAGLPKGPLPGGVKMPKNRNVQRAMRRR
jgi:hypothetical protein